VERPPEFVQSLERGLAVIRAFSDGNSRLTLSDVAKETGMSRAAARRFLITLESLGYAHSDGKFFSLRPSVLQLGYAYLSGFTFSSIAQQHLESLAEIVHESCSASVLDEHDIVYVARASTNRIMTIGLTVGARLPAYCTSMGRVLLSELTPEAISQYLTTADFSARTDRTLTNPTELLEELAKVKLNGWCLLDQELELGVRSVAVPVRDAHRRLIASINTSVHASRVNMEKLHNDILPKLQSTANNIEADIAGKN
jgi:IclR family pca regulon transcriptional regulator